MGHPPIDIAECAGTLVARIESRQAAARTRGEKLRRQAADAVRVLASEFEVRRAWLFGSLAWGDPHEESDVDLLVEGLDTRTAGDAERRVAEVVEARVDLVRAEEAPPGLCERVRREGLLLHESA
jgi:predicted nucleotidyltransferase